MRRCNRDSQDEFSRVGARGHLTLRLVVPFTQERRRRGR